MSLFKLNDPTPISASVLESLLSVDGTSGPLLDYPHLVGAAFPGAPDVNYLSQNANGVGATALSLNFIRAQPFLCKRTGVIDRLSFIQTAAGTAGSVTRIGAYRSLSNYYPGALIVDGGSIATDGANGAKSISTGFAVRRGEIIWLTHQAGVAAATVQTINDNTAAPQMFGISLGPANNSLLFVAFSFAALPDPFLIGAAFAGTGQPAIFVRYGQ